MSEPTKPTEDRVTLALFVGDQREEFTIPFTVTDDPVGAARSLLESLETRGREWLRGIDVAGPANGGVAFTGRIHDRVTGVGGSVGGTEGGVADPAEATKNLMYAMSSAMWRKLAELRELTW